VGSCGEEKAEGLIDMNNVQRMFDQEAAIFWVRDSMNQCSSSVLGFSIYDCSMGYWFMDKGSSHVFAVQLQVNLSLAVVLSTLFSKKRE